MLIQRVFIVAFMFFLCLSPASAGLLKQIEETGYEEFKNENFTKADYNKIYNSYAQFYEEFENNEDLKAFIMQTNEEFEKDDSSSVFANAPVGFLYGDNHKKNKSFFHFSKEYYDFLWKNHEKELLKYPSLAGLLHQINLIDDYGRDKMEYYINRLDKEAPNLKDSMHYDGKKLSFITKVVHYKSSDVEMASHPHYDFSGLTLMLDNSEVNDDSLKMSPYKKVYKFSDFNSIKRKYNGSDKYSSGIFTTGLALKLNKISINPNAHLVLPVKKDRFAIICFAMIPYKNVKYEQIRVSVSDLKKNLKES